MKTNILKNILVAVIMVVSTTININAYDFKVDGLYYNIISSDNRTVAVTYMDSYSAKNSSSYVSGEFEIPSKILINSITYTVTSIGSSAFSGCAGLISVTIPNSVTSIGSSAFSGCAGLTSVTIPNSVTLISSSAFNGCSGLIEINVDAENPNYSSEDGILYTKDKTTLIQFPGGKKGEVVIPSSVTSIGNYAFKYCGGLTSVTIPNSVTSIGYEAFFGCTGLTSVTIPSSVTSIGNYAFSGCSGLTSVTIPNSVTEIDDYTFYQCTGLTSVTITNSVTSIGSCAFSNCSGLTSVTIPNSVTSIGSSAFSNCTGLTSVTIPNSVTSIGNYAFNNCSSLNSIYCQWSEPIECSPKFPDDVIKNAVLYVPIGRLSAYEKVDPWRNFWNITELDYSGIENIADDEIDVKVINGSIEVDGCASVDIYSMSGQLVYRGVATRVENLAPGIYVVNAAGKTVKVLLSR